jgi:hypothetical protein
LATQKFEDRRTDSRGPIREEKAGRSAAKGVVGVLSMAPVSRSALQKMRG